MGKADGKTGAGKEKETLRNQAFHVTQQPLLRSPLGRRCLYALVCICRSTRTTWASGVLITPQNGCAVDECASTRTLLVRDQHGRSRALRQELARAAVERKLDHVALPLLYW